MLSEKEIKSIEESAQLALDNIAGTDKVARIHVGKLNEDVIDEAVKEVKATISAYVSAHGAVCGFDDEGDVLISNKNDDFNVSDDNDDCDDVSGDALMTECMMIVAASEAKIGGCIDAINMIYNKTKDLDIDELRKRIAYNEIGLVTREIALSVEWINEQLNQIKMIKHIEEKRASCAEDDQE